LTAWLKTFREGNPLSPRKSAADVGPVGDRKRFYEPQLTLKDGTPKLTVAGKPSGRPGYNTGDLIAVYWNGTYAVDEVWEVMGEPSVSSLEAWGWETDVKLVAKTHPVALEEIGVASSSLARRIRLRLRSDQEDELRRAFGL